MPHQCVRCGKTISDGSQELLSGCTDCGSRFFFYVKKQELEAKVDQIRDSLTKTEIHEMESDVRELMGKESHDKTIVLDLENIKTEGPGKFSIDISALMRGEPVVINISDGKYYIDLATAFKQGGGARFIDQLK